MKGILIVSLILFTLGPVSPASTLNEAQRWGFGILTSVTLGLLGFVAAIVLVQLGKWLKSTYFTLCIKFFFSLACGTLLGDAVIHILAESYASDQLNEYVVSGIFIGSILAFIALEKLFVRLGIVHEHWVEEDHNHNHSHGGHQDIKYQRQVEPDLNIIKDTVESNMKESLLTDQNRNSAVLNSQKQEKEVGCLESFKGKGTSGYLNLIGSTIHNTIDGLTIGLAFSTGDSTVYVPVVVAIFIHEIPRELGDVAILLKSRFTGWQTICSNGTINMLAVVGAIIGLSTSSLPDSAKNYIMVFVAGNFVYIASDIWKHLFLDSWRSNLLEVVGFLIGVGAMFGIKLMEGDD